MKLLALRRWSELDAAEQARIMGRYTHKIFDPDLMASIGRIFDDVAARGDVAVSDATEKFDGVRIPPEKLLVTQAEIDEAHASLDPKVLDAIRVGIESVSAFNRAQVAASPDWRTEIRPGVEVGERSLPIASAALFVPCGKGSFPSVLIDRDAGGRGGGTRPHRPGAAAPRRRPGGPGGAGRGEGTGPDPGPARERPGGGGGCGDRDGVGD
jgi:hypothetical protein